MRDKIGSVEELFTVIEMSGHSHPSSVGAYSSAECILRCGECLLDGGEQTCSLRGECETRCTIIGP